MFMLNNLDGKLMQSLPIDDFPGVILCFRSVCAMSDVCASINVLLYLSFKVFHCNMLSLYSDPGLLSQTVLHSLKRIIKIIKFHIFVCTGSILTKNKFETLSNLDEEYEGNFVSLSIHMLMQIMNIFLP